MVNVNFPLPPIGRRDNQERERGNRLAREREASRGAGAKTNSISTVAAEQGDAPAPSQGTALNKCRSCAKGGERWRSDPSFLRCSAFGGHGEAGERRALARKGCCYLLH